MKPFLLLATRADDAVADAEYRAVLRFGGLSGSQLVRVRLELAPLDELVPDLDLREYSGVIVGGSPFTSCDPLAQKSPVQVRVEDELERLIGDVLKLDVPFLGACYGISTLGRYLGGVLDRTFAEPVGAVRVSLTAAALADPLLAGLPGQPPNNHRTTHCHHQASKTATAYRWSAGDQSAGGAFCRAIWQSRIPHWRRNVPNALVEEDDRHNEPS